MQKIQITGQDEQARSVFLEFEAKALWERNNALKIRDRENLVATGKLFIFFSIYCAAPLSLIPLSKKSGFLTIWAMGGAWFAVSLWYMTDRIFRAYGFHLKERLFCLRQLSSLRSLILGEDKDYISKNLLSIDDFKPGSGKFSDFPERLTTSHLRNLSYFFKFITLIPLGSIAGFILFAFAPYRIINEQGGDALWILARSGLACSFLFFIWVFLSHRACAELQRHAFCARRISPNNPWPRYPKPEARALRGRKRMHLQNTIATLVTLLAVGNLFTGLPLFTEGIPFLNNLAEEFIPFYGSSRGEWAIWAHHDLGIFVLTIFTLISCFILLEKDLVINLHIARFLFRKYEEFHRFNGTLIRKQIKIESRKYIFSAIASIIFPTAALAAMLFALFLNIKLYISQF